jgi:hypothetical protein
VSRANDELQRVARRRSREDGEDGKERQRTPSKLARQRSVRCDYRCTYIRLVPLDGPRTTVMLSTQTVNVSSVRYRLSDSVYSFHSCANSVFRPAIS